MFYKPKMTVSIGEKPVVPIRFDLLDTKKPLIQEGAKHNAGLTRTASGTIVQLATPVVALIGRWVKACVFVKSVLIFECASNLQIVC